jgi:DNA polymerase III subunit delta
MTFKQILTDLNNKVYYPLYLLTGEEPYYIDKIGELIEAKILNETEKEFNLSIIYGEDTDVKTIISYAKRYPMMTNYQVVIVKEAQRVDKIEELINYIQQPLKSTILVICYKYKKIDKRTSFYKKISEKGVIFESVKVYDNRIPQWINEYINDTGYKISPKAAKILADLLGNDLGKIVNELDKVTINIPEKSEISIQQIYDNIGVSKDFNIFELQNAIGRKDIYKANQIINHFALSLKDNPIIKNITILYNFFNKLLIYHSLDNKDRNNVAAELSINPIFTNDYITAGKNYSSSKVLTIISCLREYDMKAKGVESTGSVNEGELYKELLYKILH